MKATLLSLSLSSFVLSSYAAPDIIPMNASNHIEHWQEGGSQVYFVPRHALPMVDINVIFPAGSAYDGKQPGIADLTARCLGDRSQNTKEGDLANQFADVGAIFTAGIDRDTSIARLRTQSEGGVYRKAIRTWRAALTQATFDRRCLEQEQKRMLTSQTMTGQSPNGLAQRSMYAALYRQHPYAHSTIGTASSISHINTNQLEAFYRQHYVANQAIAVIVGDLSRPAAKRLAKQSLSGLARRDKLPKPPMAKPLQQTKNIFHYLPNEQNTIVLAKLAQAHKIDDLFAQVVGNEVLGGGGLNSILYQKIRGEHALAYYAGSSATLLRGNGPFTIATQSQVNSSAKALHLAESSFNQFAKQGVNKKRLRATKKMLIARAPLKFATNIQILQRVSSLAVHHIPMGMIQNYPQHIKAVSNQDIKRVFQALAKQPWVRVVVGSKNILPQQETR